jgi:tetratricopeptide (TPR) repeat protein
MTDWQQRELTDAQQLANQASEALRSGQAEAAVQAFREVEALLDMSNSAEVSGDVNEEASSEPSAASENRVAALRLRAQIYNELGVLNQRRNAPQEARDYHQKSIDICETLRKSGVEFRANSAATHLNLSSVVAAEGDLAEARKLGERAVALIDELRAEGDNSADSLALGAYQNMSLLYARNSDFDEAADQMEKSLKLVEAMAEAGEARGLAQASQACQRLSVMLFEGGEHERALKWGKTAEQLSERAYESLGQEVLGIYVVSQINLISYNEQLGLFADAEDALWKGLEVSANHVDILRRGAAFYQNARKQADARLEKGNLPREEVEDGLKDLQQIIDDMGGLPAPEAT